MSGRKLVIAIAFIVLTIANIWYYADQMRALNNIPLRSNPLGGDEYQIGTQAVHAKQTTFWVIEGVLLLACGGLMLAASGASKNASS